MKKIYTILMVFMIVLISVITVNGALIPLQRTYESGPLYYKGTTDPVLINSSYEYSQSEFRAVWITPLASNIPKYTSQTQYKNVMTEVFNNMEKYNLNVLIYHVRIMNDALYDSELNNWSSYYNTNPDWEALPWIIEEAHKRGIEFHAWMNPYRITNSYSGSVESYANSVSNKKNAASNPVNILKGGSKLILNPGEPAVRQFIVDTVEELVNKYDVDAIHFDDYFYIESIDDTATRTKYNPKNLSVGDWRREQVDLFIHQLKDYLDVFNQENNKHVELGISPSGIWQNGDGNVTYDASGNAITTGSKTGGMEHNNGYLFSNSVKWINEEWIDYIVPQSYWAFEQPIAGFADVMSWWNKVVKYKNVNLYSGIGIYMAEGGNYSWSTNPDEMKSMMLYLNTLDNVKGFSLYSYAHLNKAVKNDAVFKVLFDNAYNAAWKENVLLPEKVAGSKINPGSLNNVSLNNDGTRNIINWDANNLAKYYAIYKSEGTITYDNSELIDVILATSSTKESYNDIASSNYHYAVLPISASNTIGQGVEVSSGGQILTFKVEFYDSNGSVIKTQFVEQNTSAAAPNDPLKTGYSFKGWDKAFNNVTSNLKVYPEYTINTYNVTFKINGEVVSLQEIEYNKNAIAPVPMEIDGYQFIKWDQPYNNISNDLVINGVYGIKTFVVEYYDGNTLLKSEIVEYGGSGNAPIPPKKEGLEFLSWDRELTNITSDLKINAVYSDALYEIKFFVDGIQQGSTQYVKFGEDALAPIVSKPGYGFVSWDKELTNIRQNTNFNANFSDSIFQVRFLVNGVVVKTSIVLYGETVIAPEINMEGINFINWDQSFEYITKNLNINAIYDVIQYTVNYKVDGIIVKSEVVNHGESSIAPSITNKEGYVFVKWDKQFNNIKEDTTINAEYRRIIFSVSFIYDNKIISSQDVYYGEDAVVPEFTLKSGDIFKGWNLDFTNVKENLLVNAVVEKQKFTVTFYDINDNVIETYDVESGKSIKAIDAPEVENKTFDKWDKDLSKILENTEVRPIYKDVQASVSNCSSFNIFQAISVFMAFGLIIIFRKKH